MRGLKARIAAASSLFDYFIATPARDRRMREAMDERIKEAGRKPIEPVPDDLSETDS
jgi:hypothetical protein